MITLHCTDARDLAWAQHQVAQHHYLHSRVDPRCRPLAYIVTLGAAWIGCLIVGRPESTRCYTGALTYGSQADVAAGRAQYDRWEVLNLARVWLHPDVQAGGVSCQPELLPGYTDRRGVWRSTLASTLIRQLRGRVSYDYLARYPPCFIDEPYQVKVLLSYCDGRYHKGTLYQASGFTRAREARQIATWCAPVTGLTAEQDLHIRRLTEQSARSRLYRARRAAAYDQSCLHI